MSGWPEVLGWCIVAVGFWLTPKAVRTLVRLYRLGKDQAIQPVHRRDAWRDVVSGPFCLALGVLWLYDPATSGVLFWLPTAYVAMLVIWDVGSQFWFRSEHGQAAGQ